MSDRKTIQQHVIEYARYQSRGIAIANVFLKNSPFEIDVLLVKQSLLFNEYEIKTSAADFNKDFEKRCVWRSVNKHENLAGDGDKVPRPKQFYFVCPAGLIPVERIPEHAGLIEFGEFGYWKLKVMKRAPTLKNPSKLDSDDLFNLCLKASFRIPANR